MSDGGEGLLEALGGDARTHDRAPARSARRSRPSGACSPAGDGGPDRGRSRCPGRPAARCSPTPGATTRVRAGTAGVGQLLLAARDAGARADRRRLRRVGHHRRGRGAFEAVGSPAALAGRGARRGLRRHHAVHRRGRGVRPAEGRHPRAGGTLGRRLGSTGRRGTGGTGVDVTTVPGAGAAGGLAGGLVALGARIEPGFDLVAGLVGLAERLGGRPGRHGRGPPRPTLLPRQGARRRARRLARRTTGACPVLCIVGGADRALLRRPAGGDGDRQPERRASAGPGPAARPPALIGQVTAEALARFCP